MFELFGSRAENAAMLETLVKTFAEQDKAQKSFPISIPLEIPLQATLIREGKKQTVDLKSGSHHISLKRDTHDDPGDLSVSCQHNGNEVSVWTINVEFRSIDDIYTDRGVVWIYPGTPMVAQFFLTRRSLDAPGLISEIANAANRAVNEKVLKHFTQPVH